MSVGAATAVAFAFINLADVNEKPEITNAPELPIDAPYGLGPDEGIFQFEATDPDNKIVPNKQLLTFSLVDPSNTFKITPDGILQMKIENWAGTPFDPTFTFTVKVTDSGDPAKSDSKAVKVTFGTGATIFADQQATEGGVDNISLRFRRYSSNITSSLSLNFRVQFGGIVGSVDQLDYSYRHLSPGNASSDDITFESLANITPCPNSETGAVQYYEGSITIPAGQDESAPVTIAAVSDGLLEGVELFSVELLPGAGYTILSRSVEDPLNVDGGRSTIFTGASQHTLAIMDGVTLFAPYNTNGNLKDYVTEDSELGGNPGIHVNDVRQGSVGNCFYIGALAAIVNRPDGWRAIERLFQPLEGGGYRVALYEQVGEAEYAWRWKNYTAADLLARGTFGAILSGDRSMDGKSEIWTTLLERRFMESTYARGSSYGGTDKSLLALTGVSPEWIDMTGKDNSEIVAAIKSHLDGFVVVSTKAIFAGNKVKLDVNANPDAIRARHAYVVSAASLTEGLSLINPWGYEHVNPLPIAKTNDVLQSGFFYLPPDLGTGP